MKRSVTLPQITIDSFNTVLVSGDSSIIYHVYVNGEFYRALSSREELNNLLNLFIQNELGGI